MLWEMQVHRATAQLEQGFEVPLCQQHGKQTCDMKKNLRDILQNSRTTLNKGEKRGQI